MQNLFLLLLFPAYAGCVAELTGVKLINPEGKY